MPTRRLRLGPEVIDVYLLMKGLSVDREYIMFELVDEMKSVDVGFGRPERGGI